MYLLLFLQGMFKRQLLDGSCIFGPVLNSFLFVHLLQIYNIQITEDKMGFYMPSNVGYSSLDLGKNYLKVYFLDIFISFVVLLPTS